MLLAEKMEEKLRRELQATRVELENESEQHRSHHEGGGGESHFAVTVVSPYFEAKTLLERHRLVYDCLAPFLKRGVHALKIRALSPSEAALGI